MPEMVEDNLAPLLGSKPTEQVDVEVVLPLRFCSTLLLNTDTPKPVPDISDEFWNKFCQEVEIRYPRVFILGLFTSIYCVFGLGFSIFTAFQRDFDGACTMLLFCSTLYYSICIRRSGGDHGLQHFLAILNLHCRDQLQGYRLMYEVDLLGMRGHLKIQRLVQSDCEGHGSPKEGQEPPPPELEEFRVYLHAPAASKRGDKCYPLDVDTAPPPGISPTAWKDFLNDIASNMDEWDTLFETTIIMTAASFMLSTLLEHFGGITCAFFLFWMAFCCIFFHVNFRRSMLWKFKIIKTFEGRLFGPHYELSYHPVQWYSRRGDYILFKRCDPSGV